MDTLTAKRTTQTEGTYKGFLQTELYNEAGKKVATFPAYTKQPRFNRKTITLNCFTYRLNWQTN